MIRRPADKCAARIKHSDHKAIWMAVEGAVVDAFNSHPEYLTKKGRSCVVESVTKRVVGQLVGKISEAQSAGQ